MRENTDQNKSDYGHVLRTFLMFDWVLNTPLSQLYIIHALPFWQNLAYSSRLSFFENKCKITEINCDKQVVGLFYIQFLFASNIQLENDVSQDT